MLSLFSIQINKINFSENTLTASKLRHSLQCLNNIDQKIEGFFTNTIKKEQTSFIIFMTTELKIFLNNLIEFYKLNNPNETDSPVTYEFVITKDNNIFKKMLSKNKINEFLKIFYRLGLEDHEEDEEEHKFIFVFNLDKNVTRKMIFISSFIDMLLNCLKN